MNQEKLMKLLHAPIISEKSTLAAENYRRFAFKVDKTATKPEVKKAVEQMFEVEVDSVQIANMKGKVKRFGRYLGKRSDWKKAYVRLKPGFDIEFGGG